MFDFSFSFIFIFLLPALLLPLVGGSNFNHYHNLKRSPSSYANQNARNFDRHHGNHLHGNDGFRSKVRPNIIFILTDDQDAELGSLDYMPKTTRYLRSEGATFTNAYSTTPMCCPSRSSMLTGMYVHNHNTYSNNENCSGPIWREKYEVNSFGKLLQDAGYQTGYFGKYLNEYSGAYVPIGWSEWMGLVKNTRYYNYTLNHNGSLVKHRDDYSKDYLTDVITRNSVDFLKRSKKFNPTTPVAMVLSMPAPHGPEDSAPQYQKLFMGAKSHRTPSWNHAPNPDKQWLLQYTSKMSKLQMEFTDLLNTKRLQTLQSVDEAVEKVCQTLSSMGELDNTFIFYTSDHGYHLGQFGLVKGKAMPYEFDIKVPFLVRGPGVPKNVTLPNIVLNLDLAPTFLDIAGIPPLPIMDGASILKVLNNADDSNGVKKKSSIKWRDTFLVERGKLTAKKLRLVDKIEAQINNLTKSKNEKMEIECTKPEFQPPCKPNQKWMCLKNERGEKRFFKCRIHSNQSYPLKPKCRCHLSSKEKELQLSFLKSNVNQPEKIQPNFIEGGSNVKKRSSNQNATLGPHLSKEWSFVKADLPDLSIPCRIGEQGSVDCQPLVYSNPELWKKQADLLEKFIKYFNETISSLQKFREHLQERRPSSSSSSSSSSSDLHPNNNNTINSVLDMSELLQSGGSDDDDEDDVNEVDDYNNVADCSCDEDYDEQNVVFKKRSPWFVRRRRKLENSTKKKKLYKKHRYVLDTDSRSSLETSQNGGCNSYDGCPHLYGHDNSTWDLTNHARNDPACQIQGLECFRMDNDHWKVKPFWERGPFCSCSNANNNTYWCLRTINETHNFLFCEFITGFFSYYDFNQDHYQMKNIVKDLSHHVLQELLTRLGTMKNCRGRECHFRYGAKIMPRRYGPDKYPKAFYKRHQLKNRFW